MSATKNPVNQAKLKKFKSELETLKQLADKQTHLYKGAKKLLYEGLCKAYLWWREVSKEKGLLEQLYEEYNIQYKQQLKQDRINFSPLLRFLWGMDARQNSNTIDQWNRALNAMDIEVNANKEYYSVNTQTRLENLISNSGGVQKMAGYAPPGLQSHFSEIISHPPKPDHSGFWQNEFFYLHRPIFE